MENILSLPTPCYVIDEKSLIKNLEKGIYGFGIYYSSVIQNLKKTPFNSQKFNGFEKAESDLVDEAKN